MGLRDQFGRNITYLRVSVTDRCNFRCVYCMPEVGVAFRPKDELLTFEELTKLISIFYDLGVRKIRLTGGEPLVRKDIPTLVRMIRSIAGDLAIHMTTNGYFLTDLGPELKDAGLNGLNVSLDSLRPERVFQISRRHYLPQILSGIEMALKLGFKPLKINTVLIRGINEDEIADFAEFTKTQPVHVRFIEFMPYRDNQWSQDKVVSGKEIASILSERYPEADSFEGLETDGVSQLVRIPGHLGAVGFINTMTDKFCSSCNRVRLTSDGQLRLCLFSETGADLKSLLRSGRSEVEIRDVISNSVLVDKPYANPLPNAEQVNVHRFMVEVGG